jgi:hypothetical protein
MKLRLRPCILLSLVAAARLTAQVDQGSLNGTIIDATKSVVPGAKVEVVSVSTGFRREL